MGMLLHMHECKTVIVVIILYDRWFVNTVLKDIRGVFEDRVNRICSNILLLVSLPIDQSLLMKAYIF